MERIVNLIRENDNFVLAGHTGPDGDAIGSCFALAFALKNFGKNVQVVLEPFARKYNIIPGKEFLFSGNLETLQPDVFIALDCADPERLGASRVLFERSKITACIDHHETNIGFADYNFIEPTASSTSEMTLWIIERFTETTNEIAAAVYAGMVSDTGGFRYNATAKSTMVKAARLMEQIPFTQIYDELMHKHRFAAIKAMGFVAKNCARTRNKRIVYSHITREELCAADAESADLEGAVEYLVGTRNALAAILIYEKKADTVKVSLRSQGPNMARVAASLGGGGHSLAAGATVSGTIEDVMKKTLALVKKEVTVYQHAK
jgi:phosphoesterase RecJ-like protein